MTTTETFRPSASIGGLQRFGMGAALVGVVVTIVGFVLAGQERFFQAYLVAYTYLDGCRARQHGPPDGPAPLRRCLGCGHPPAARGRGAHAADHDGALHPDRARHGGPVSLDACGCGRQRSDHSREGALPQHAVLPRPAGLLLRVLDRPGYTADTVVGRAGSHRRPGTRRQAREAVGRRARALRPDGDLRHGRLDDVGQPALVLDDLGAALHRRPGAVGDGVRDQ